MRSQARLLFGQLTAARGIDGLLYLDHGTPESVGTRAGGDASDDVLAELSERVDEANRQDLARGGP